MPLQSNITDPNKIFTVGLPLLYTTCEKKMVENRRRPASLQAYMAPTKQIKRKTNFCMHGRRCCLHETKKISQPQLQPQLTSRAHSLTHGTREAETSPNHTSRLMIKTWIHGQLLSLLYSRNMHEQNTAQEQLTSCQH